MPPQKLQDTFGCILPSEPVPAYIMTMILTPLDIPDVILVQTTRHIDERGYFTETYRKSAYADLPHEFIQDNFVHSKFRVLRGLHLQLPPKAQGKLVHVVQGEIFDVAVDLRSNSGTFGDWVGIRMHSDEGVQLWIPPGFAHGYMVLSEEGADVAYKVTEEYNPHLEAGLRWSDPEIGISWPIPDPIVSDKDQELPTLTESGFGENPNNTRPEAS